MIAFIEPLPVGNAIRVLLSPPANAARWRLLRKLADNFTGQDDPDAAVIYDGSDARAVLDTNALVNGTPYYYREYDFDGAAWTASPTISATPATSGQDVEADVLSLVRDRLELYLRSVVANGGLSNSLGYIPCLTAPPQFEGTAFPLVVVHLQNDSSMGGRAIGEELSGDEDSLSEGWLSRVQLQINAWSLNPDERIALRRAIKAGIQANLPVFDDAGMVQIDLSQTDIDEMERFDAPVFQAISSFSCLAPSVFSGPLDAVTDVTVTATVDA